MPDLETTTALGATTPRHTRHGPWRVEENPTLALVSLTLRRGVEAPSPFGLPLPAPGKWVRHGDHAAFWTGQEQWFIEGFGLAETDFASDVAVLCPGCSVTEQTDGFVAFDIIGDDGEGRIADVMGKLVNLDPIGFGPGSATRTAMDHMSVFVIRRAPEHLTVIGMRSAAQSLWHVLETAVRRQVAKTA